MIRWQMATYGCLAARTAAVLFAMAAMPADAQNNPELVPPGSAGALPGKTADEVARELANPNNSLASLSFKNQFRWYTGSFPDANNQDNYTLLFQAVFPFPLKPTDSGGMANLFVRPAIPLLTNQPVPTASSGQLGFDKVTALGDIGFDVGYGVTEKSGLLWAYGMVGTLPTATNSEVAGKQLRLGPEALFAKFENWSLHGIFPSHQWNVAGWNDNSYGTSQLQVFLKIPARRRMGCRLDTDHELRLDVQAVVHSLEPHAGCTSILSWGGHSADGGMCIGRNMDWSPEFNKFPQVLTVRRPTDGSYKFATMGWPGMYCAFTALNEHGVYLDVHDGTSMGGSLVFEDRPSILNVLTDLMSETTSLKALLSRLNGIWHSTSMILSVGDETSGASMECSSLAGNRVRLPEGDSIAVVNTFLEADWGLGKRETVSNSLRRYSNMTDRLADNKGKVNAEVVRHIMDLRLFNEDGSFAENGGATKPTKQDADLTTHQVVTDVKRREMWMKVPVPDFFADWTHVDLKELWG